MQRILCLLTTAAFLGVGAQMAYDHGKIVSCYYSSWAYYRPGIGQFDVDDIDPSLCSHGFYGFADLNNQTWEIDAIDINFDLCPEECPEGEVCQYCGFSRFTALQEENPDFHPLLSIGGWNAGSGEYSLMAADPEKRAIFVASVPPYLKQYGFVGLDLDWEYPGSREGADVDNDKANFVALSEEMSAALKAEGLLLTIAIAAGVHRAEVAYDVEAIIDYYDFFNVMTYDYHGYFPPDETFTGQNAPIRIYDVEDDPDHPGYQCSYRDIVDWYMNEGMPVEMMVMGAPTYGRGFTLGLPDGETDATDTDAYEDGFYCPSERAFPMGPYTRQAGHYGYLEVEQLFVNDTLLFMPDAIPGNWERIWDECYQAPRLRNGPYWLGYDDEESITIKTMYANALGAGGMMIWSIETDDFGAFYSDQQYPLLRTINEVLLSGETWDIEDDEACRGQPEDYCDIIGNLAADCTEEDEGEKIPYPGSCHDYYYCVPIDDDEYTTERYTCGDWVFDPISQECINPNSPGADDLCGQLVDP